MSGYKPEMSNPVGGLPPFLEPSWNRFQQTLWKGWSQLALETFWVSHRPFEHQRPAPAPGAAALRLGSTFGVVQFVDELVAPLLLKEALHLTKGP